MSDGGVAVARPPGVFRCKTAVGVLGEDWKEFSSTNWSTENRNRFLPCSGQRQRRPPQLITRLDGSRHHNPHAQLARHLNQLHGKKPVCNIQTLLREPTPDMSMEPSIYTTHFRYREPKHTRYLIFRRDLEKQVHGIIPQHSIPPKSDVREEMMLPVCDSVEIPSLDNPRTYFPRRKRVRTPYQDEGVFYEAAQCPTTVIKPKVNLGITNLTGQEFTRRRFVPPPRSTLTVKDFDGGPPPVDPSTFQAQMMPFMRSKTII